MKGLEPLLLSKPDPKSGASTNSATPAILRAQRYNFFLNVVINSSHPRPREVHFQSA